MENNILAKLKLILKQLFGNRILLVALFFSVVFLFSFIFFAFSRSSKKVDLAQKTKTGTSLPTSESREDKRFAENLSRPAPKVYFKTYEDKSNNNPFPFLKSENISHYILKSDFSNEEIISFAQKLGLTELKPTLEKSVFVYNFKDKDKKGILNFNRQTGSFYYFSYGILKPVSFTASNSKVHIAEAFLKELGLSDNTIRCTNTYQRKNLQTDTTYVECHRDWEKTEVPIVNLGGVLNIAENKKISDLNVGKLDDLSPPDKDIINVKTISKTGSLINNSKDDGYTRPNDFNTITFGITENGEILSIESTLRWIKEVKTAKKNQDLVTLDGALALFKNHKYQYALTLPSGTGTVDFNKVYPQNQAVSKNAIIQDVSLVFLDKPMDTIQTEYEPFFLIRGIAALETGYNVRFAQVLPALKEKQTSFINKTTDVAGENTAQKKLQLDTFTPGQNYVPPDLGVSPTPVPTVYEGPQLPSECSSLDGIDVKLNIPGYGTLIVAASSYELGYHSFFFKSSNNPTQDTETLKNMFFKAVEDQYVINMAKWLKEQTVTPVFNTVEDLYRIFRKINVRFDLPDSPLASHCLIFISKYEAPIPPSCASVEAAGNLDIDRAHKIAENVANRILQLRSENKLLDEANKENIFSDRTLRAFYMIFDDVPWDKTGLPEHGRIAKCYITGGSPILYLYPKQKTEVSISTNAPLSYTDPSIIKNTWNAVVFPDGTINQNGVTRPGIYYEYDKNKVKFSEPSTGFIIKTTEWKEFIKNNLSQKLGLNEKETQSLITEINNALVGKAQAPYLKLSLIPQAELDQKLPLSINPKPDNIYRINVFVTPLNEPRHSVLDTESTKIPESSSGQALNQVQDDNFRTGFIPIKSGFTVVEIGAYSN